MQGDLFDHTLDETAIKAIRLLSPKDAPLWVAFSGGKDSVVVLDLVRRAGVDHVVHYGVTTVDPPEVLRFMKQHYPDVIWDRAGTTMFREIARKGLPLRAVRWCCEIFKEGQGKPVVATGVRWEESSKRATRRLFEPCNRNKRKHYLNPIIAWTATDVWGYIRERELSYCSLYDEGFRRIGCVGCPFERQVERSQARWPRIWANYKRAAQRWWDKCETKNPGQTFEDFWQTWCDRDGSWKDEDEICPLFT